MDHLTDQEILDKYPSPRLVFENGKIRRDLCLLFLGLKFQERQEGTRTVIEVHLEQTTPTQSLLSIVSLNNGGGGGGGDHQLKINLTLKRGVKQALQEAVWDLSKNGTQAFGFKTHVKLEEGAECELMWVASNSGRRTINREVSFEMYGGSRLRLLQIAINMTAYNNSTQIHFWGPRAKAELYNVAMQKGNERQKVTSEVVHHVGGSESIQLHKSLLLDSSHNQFTGKIEILRGAQKASSEQLSQSLILGDGAESFFLPILEIEADDVTATHGASTAKLDPEEIFYLQSRGITEKRAKQVLASAFLEDVLLRVENQALLGEARNLVRGALPKELSL